MRIHFSLLSIYSTLLSTTTTHAQTDTAVDDKPHPFLNKVQPFGYQSTSSKGNDFAASIVKSPRDAQGYFTAGTTSGMLIHTNNDLNDHIFHAGMHCYVMQMKPYVDNWTWIKKFGAFRNKNPTPTTCTSVRTLPVKDGDTDTKIMVLGYTEGDSLFNPDDGRLSFSKISEVDASQNKVNGFVILLSVPHSEEEKKEVDPQMIKVISGSMLNEEKVTYPISVTSVGENDMNRNDMVIVSMVTDNTGVNLEAALKDAAGEIGDFEPEFRYGQFYKVKVERLSYEPSTGLLKKLWSDIYEADNGLGAQVTSIIFDDLEDSVTVAGTTHGQGVAFGRKNVVSDIGKTESDLDGFLFTLDATTGELDESITKRVETIPGKDEFISGMCKKARGDALYIVGSTNAILGDNLGPAYDIDLDSRKFNAFIRKINLNAMETIWTRQIGPVNITNNVAKDNQDVFGMGCAVDEEKSQVYVSGTVAAGASVVPGQYPTGEQDIFVASFQSTHGTPLGSFQTQQLGSVLDEYVAKDGGGLTTDQYGNAVLFGTTKGNFIHEKPPKLTQFAVPFSDIYFMSFSAEDGEHVSTIKCGMCDDTMTATATDTGAKNKSMSPLEISSILLFVSFASIAIFILAFNFGKRRGTSEYEHQTDKDVARCIENVEENFARGKGKKYARVKRKKFARGMGNPTEITVPDDKVPDEVSTPGDEESSTSTNTKVYDELMDSFKHIMLT